MDGMLGGMKSLAMSFFKLAHNVFGLGEVAEHKTSIELQMFKLKIECQTKK